MTGANLKEDDVIEEMFIASTHEYVLFFSNRGKVYRLKVHELPVGTRQARGTAIVNLLPFEDGEKIASVISCREFPDNEYLMFATASGMVKKTVMSAYDRSRRDGIIAINLKSGDNLLDVRRVREGDKVILATTAGKAITREGCLVMPLSIYVNHAFVDGSHLSLFFQKIEQHLKEIAEAGNPE